MIFKKGLSIKNIAHFLEGESPTLKVSHKDRYVRSSRSEMFFRKVVLKICSKFTREQPSRSVICNCNFIEIALQHGCSPVDLLHIFRTLFLKNTSGRLLLIRCDTDFVFNGCFQTLNSHKSHICFKRDRTVQVPALSDNFLIKFPLITL